MHEAAFAAVLADWRVLFRMPRWLAAGRARFKQELAGALAVRRGTVCHTVPRCCG